jgi:hypothetical protein
MGARLIALCSCMGLGMACTGGPHPLPPFGPGLDAGLDFGGSDSAGPGGLSTSAGASGTPNGGGGGGRAASPAAGGGAAGNTATAGASGTTHPPSDAAVDCGVDDLDRDAGLGCAVDEDSGTLRH